ncbi:MAG: hypothetical protein PHD81_03045 [Candidatus Nanoarchaeia archaeon]|nr:hypothetical protein [Candidatus Nanoarchaeia archaeon]MDD5588061.1 hypothetical protein [Candidatus Nanoarchaeia archaeon]
MPEIIGDKGKSRFDPDLAREINEKIERGSRKETIEEKLNPEQEPIVQPIERPKSLPNNSVLILDKDDLTNYIFLEGKVYGDYSYSDRFVSKYKLREVVKSSHYDNYSQHSPVGGKGFIYEPTKFSWTEALTINQELGGTTLNLRQFVDFLNLLKSGRAFDGKGYIIDSQELKMIYSDITEKDKFYRAEWLDVAFKEINDKLYLLSEHKLENGGLVPKYIKELSQSTLMSFTKIGSQLSLTSFFKKGWLDTANEQGLPTVETKKSGKLTYYYPRKNSVTNFGVKEEGPYLQCRDPYFETGVRLVRPEKF